MTATCSSGWSPTATPCRTSMCCSAPWGPHSSGCCLPLGRNGRSRQRVPPARAHAARPPPARPEVIDLHCHILPELDDGALSLDDSVAMARQAEEDGITVVCATPHIRHDHEVCIEEIASHVG